MTLKQAPYYWLECDGCGDLSTEHTEFAAWQDFGYAIDSALDHDWLVYTVDDKDVHLCPDCVPTNSEGEPWEEIPDTVHTFNNTLIGQAVEVRRGNIPFIPIERYMRVTTDLWLELDIDEERNSILDEKSFSYENCDFRTLDNRKLAGFNDWKALPLGTVLVDYEDDEWIKIDHHLVALLFTTAQMKQNFEEPIQPRRSHP